MVFRDNPVCRSISRMGICSRWCHRRMTLNNSMSITPITPTVPSGTWVRHGSFLSENSDPLRVRSQCNSTAEVLPEDVWAALFVLGGLLCLARPWLRWRRVRLLPWMGIAFLEGVVALSMSIAALRGEVAGLNIGAHLVLVALSYVCLMREAALIRDVAPAP